jgi:hypothetical protein
MAPSIPQPQPPPPSDPPDIFKLLFKFILKLNPLDGIRELTELEDILEYFATNTPDDFDVKAGLLLKQHSGGSYLVAQCFLNAAETLSCDNSGRPYGRLFRTLEFDTGLQELFGHEDLIIFT